MVEAASLAVQPWVNLGRLFRMQGHPEAALQQFAAVYRSDPEKRTEFAGFSIGAGETRYDNAQLLYLFDSSRTYAQTRRYADGLRFIQNLRPVITADNAPIADEFECQFLLHLEEEAGAARALEREAWKESRHSSAVNALYRCVLLTNSGVDCREVVPQLSAYIREALVSPDGFDHRDLRYAIEVVRLLRRSGQEEGATELLVASDGACARNEDIPTRHEIAVATLNPGSTPRGATGGPDHILVTGGYVGYAKRYGIAAPLPGEAAEALARLAGTLEQVFDRALGSVREAQRA
jgi:hypothetical protein